ncbi:hypothetical protein V6N13_046198 [Hibiscus sabdariffa]|uniref:Uncharacterized protein n=1 Tax=Hibiscus sabdariffa TaxID=183260 RepID=A0ABR2N642_9ROSI
MDPTSGDDFPLSDLSFTGEGSVSPGSFMRQWYLNSAQVHTGVPEGNAGSLMNLKHLNSAQIHPGVPDGNPRSFINPGYLKSAQNNPGVQEGNPCSFMNPSYLNSAQIKPGVPEGNPGSFMNPRYMNSAQFNPGVPDGNPGSFMFPRQLNLAQIHPGVEVENPGSFMCPSLSQNYPGASSGGNGKSDREYREREKNKKVQMVLDFKKLEEENDFLRTTNQSLLEVNASMNQFLTNQQNMFHQLRSDLSLIKQNHVKLDAQWKALALDNGGPLGIEIEKLMAENASLVTNTSQFLREIDKLTNDIKLLKVILVMLEPASSFEIRMVIAVRGPTEHYESAYRDRCPCCSHDDVSNSPLGSLVCDCRILMQSSHVIKLLITGTGRVVTSVLMHLLCSY